MNRMQLLSLGALLLMLQACGTASSTNGSGAMPSLGGSGGGNPGSTGGGSNSNGAAGAAAGGSPPVAVLPCDKLPAPGTWERIGPEVSYKSSAWAVSSAIDPNQAGTVYAGFAMGGLWKSTDCGATWAHIDTGTNASALDSGDQWGLYVDPMTSDVYADSGYGGTGLYRSKNGGVDFENITPTGPGIPTFVQAFSIDPTDNKHMIVGFHDNCTGAYAPMCFAETTDSAAHWRFVKGPAKGWGEGAGPMLVGGKVWLYGAPFDGLYYTDSAGASWEKVIDYPGCFYGLTFADGNYYIGCFNSIRYSKDAHTWTSIDKTPTTTAIVQAGTSLYSSFQNDTSMQPVWTATLDAPTAWTNVKTPPMTSGASPGNMSYDAAHHVLFLPAWGAGLWRIVTP